MKKIMLVLLMTITILLSGCDNKEKIENKQNKDIVENENNNNEENNKDEESKEENSETHQVNFYLFYSASCGHCHSEREWIASIEDEYPNVNFKLYEVSENEDLFLLVNEAFDVDNSAVPVTIIGNNYMIGYSESKNRKFIRYIEELSTFESCDVVQAVIDGKDVEACMKQNEQ